MITTIARKEGTELMRDGRFRWAAVTILVLLLAALVAGARHQRDLVAQQHAAQAAERDRWLAQTPKNPHSAAHYGLYAFKPRLAPAFLDPGVEPYTGVTVWLEAHRQNELLFRPAEDATLAQRFGDLTVALVLQVVLPLAIVLLAFGAFAGERERGTLRQLLALGLRPRELVLGKLLGIGAALSLIVLPAALLGAGRFLVLTLVHVLWLAVFVLVTLAVSARAPSPRFALVVLLGFWALNCLLAPRVLSDIAARRHPLPEPVAFRARLKDALGDPHGAPARFAERTAELMRQRGVARPEDLGLNLNGLRLQTSEEHSDEIFDRFYAELFSPMAAQNAFLTRAGAVFPLLGVQSLSMGLAGTDFAQHRDFMRAADQHRRKIQVIMNEDIMAHPLPPGAPAYLAGPEVWAKVPPFTYAPRGVTAVLAAHALPLGLLGLWVAAAGWFALRSAAALRPV
jgi:ABC-2 type transport system permease protein